MPKNDPFLGIFYWGALLADNQLAVLLLPKYGLTSKKWKVYLVFMLVNKIK